jgi:hypothetical protein
MPETTTAVSVVESLLADLERRGVELHVKGERLRYSAPPGALTPGLLEQLRTHKAELMVRLQKNGVGPQPAVGTCSPSFAQRRFWALQRLNPTESFYNAPFVFRLEGSLDVEILRESFNAVVRRHESLRTTLQELDGELMQVIADQGEVNFSFISLRDCPATLRAESVSSFLQADVERPFELAREAGLRVLLLQLDSNEHILQLLFHNTLFDLSSLIILLDEISLHYAALLARTSLALPPPAQYSEYVRWQEAFTSSGAAERLNYWQDWFRQGKPPDWTWTPSRRKPAAFSFHTHVSWLRYSPELTRRLKGLIQRNGVTLYIALMAAYAIILRRYTGCADLTIGTTYSNRHHWQFASLVGATLDVPALRIDMSDDPGLLTLLARVRTVVAAALSYQDLPFAKIAPSLPVALEPAAPLFRTVFSFFPETAHGRLQLPQVTVTFLEELINDVSRPDLYLVFWENETDAGKALTGYWMHKKDVFTAETARRMNREFEELLSLIVDHPEGTVSELLNAWGPLALD